MKNLLLIFMILFAVDSIAQLDQREKGDVVSPALNKNPNFIQKTGWTIEAIDPINDTLCSVTPSSDRLAILTENVCNARVYQDINSADIRKARFAKETMTALLKLQSLTYVKITLNVYKKAATTGTLTLLRTQSLENNTNVPLQNKKIIFDVVTEDLNFASGSNLADSLRIEFTFEPTVVFPAGVAKVEVDDFRVFSSPMNYSPLLHEVREESGWTEWQPTWEAVPTNPSIGNGTLIGRYRRNGASLDLEISLVAGSTTTFGSGSWSFSLPNGLVASTIADLDSQSGGTVFLRRTGEQNWTLGTVSFFGNVIRVKTTGYVNATFPFTFQEGSTLSIKASTPIEEWKQSSVVASSTSPKLIRVTAQASAAQSLADDYNTIQLNQKNQDTHNAFNTSTYTFTSPERTCYDVKGIVRFDKSSNSNDLFSALSVTDTYVSPPYLGGTRISSADTVASEVNRNICLNVGGTIKLSAFRGAGGTRSTEWRSSLQITETPESFYVRAFLKESMIEKDVDQFPLVETVWGVAEGKTLYKRCFKVTNDLTTDGIIANIGAGLQLINAIKYSSTNWILQIHYGPSSGSLAQLNYKENSGDVEAWMTGSYVLKAGTRFCVKYTKD